MPQGWGPPMVFVQISLRQGQNNNNNNNNKSKIVSKTGNIRDKFNKRHIRLLH